MSLPTPHLGLLIFLWPLSTSLKLHIGHLVDVPRGSTAATGTPCFPTCQSI